MKNLSEETVLAARAGDDKAMDELVRRMTPLVRSAARKSVAGSTTTPQEDMEQEAWAGVFEALQTFDPELGSFETWAFLPMRSAIQKAFPRYVAGPTVERNTSSQYSQAMGLAEGDVEEAEEIFVSMGRSRGAFHDAHSVFTGTYSTSAFSDSEADRFDIEDPGDGFDDVLTRVEAEQWLDLLDPEEEIILRYSVGLGSMDEEPMTDEEISELMEIPRRTIHRKRTKALKKLRELAEGES